MSNTYHFDTIPPGSARVYPAPEDPFYVTSAACRWGKSNKVRVQTRVAGDDVVVYVGDVTIPRDGVKGVFFRKDQNCWVANMYLGRQRRLYKTFDTLEEAIQQRKTWEERYP